MFSQNRSDPGLLKCPGNRVLLPASEKAIIRLSQALGQENEALNFKIGERSSLEDKLVKLDDLHGPD